MGTRNLTCVAIDNSYKVSQYGQWDGYPSGQGVTILNFLRNKLNRPLMEKRLREVQFLNDEEIELINKSNEELPRQFSRDCGGRILEFLQNGEYIKSELVGWDGDRKSVTYTWKMDKLHNRLDFAGDSLFCEWAYVVDFDENTFEVYEGFVKEPHEGERFSNMEYEKSHREPQYYPIKLKKKYDLNNLPTEEEFLKELEEQEEQDDAY
jgi:hypothetical protein